jgi:hypothetical protein
MTKKETKKKDTVGKKAVGAKRKGAAAKAAIKQPSARAQRIAKKKAPKAVENTKQAIFLRGSKTSELVGDVMKDLFGLRKPHGVMMQRKNDNMHPFDDAASLEFLAGKNDCSIFCVANHSKKRPHNLVVGRTFDGHVLDMVELGVETATTLDDLQLAFPEASVRSSSEGSEARHSHRRPHKRPREQAHPRRERAPREQARRAPTPRPRWPLLGTRARCVRTATLPHALVRALSPAPSHRLHHLLVCHFLPFLFFSLHLRTHPTAIRSSRSGWGPSRACASSGRRGSSRSTTSSSGRFFSTSLKAR